MHDLDALISSAEQAVRNAQQPDGGFLHLSSADKDNFENGELKSTSFFVANILNSLNTLSEVEDIKKRCVKFLLHERSERWSFNYWAHSAKERQSQPYPDDLDDTSVALLALVGSGTREIDGAALGRITQLLTALEVDEGGPYRTWIVGADSKPEWLDVDLAVNANVGRFLAKLDITLPKLNAFIAERICSGNFISPYYPDEYPILYFISVFYKGEAENELREKLISLAHAQSGKRNALQSALLVISLIALGENFLAEDEVKMMARCIKDKGWQPYAFCIDPSKDGKRCYAGSSALTAAFCAEAIARYDAMKDIQNKGILPAMDARVMAIKGRAKKRAASTPPSLRSVVLEQIESTNDPKIMLLPYGVADSFGIDPDFLEQLGLANLYGWMAYTIYDDFLDDEGDSHLLSAANYFLRELTTTFISLEQKAPGISKIYEQYMNVIDDANTEEQEKTPPVDRLADRSIGHALPAIAILLNKGYASDSSAGEHTKNFFKNYLIARQLHDDAHDWESDLRRERINTVGARLVQAENVDGKIDSETISMLQKKFWYRTIDAVTDDIFIYINKARSELGALKTVFPRQDFFNDLLDALETAARKTIAERDEAILFLKEYTIK